MLHKEYPTLAKYQRQAEKKLKHDPHARRRGHFDISIWNPENIRHREHRKQKVLIAAELALNECGSQSVHTTNDLTKLKNFENKVKYGYLLFFVRDDKSYNQNELRLGVS